MGLLGSRRKRQDVKYRPQTFEQGKSFPTPAPYAGINLRDDINALKPNQARVLENWVPGTGQLTFRTGIAQHVGGLSGSEVKTLAAFQGFSAQKLVAVTGGRFFDVSAELEDALAGNDDDTKVLLHMNGVDASTTFTDSNIGGSSH